MNQPMKTMHSSIQQCQFIQESLDVLKVKVIPTAEWVDAVHHPELEKNIRKQAGSTIRIDIEKVTEIPTRKNGKYQFIVSKLDKATCQDKNVCLR